MITKSGDIAEIRFSLLFLDAGFMVSRPMTCSGPYDFIVDIEGTLLKVQVKSTSYQNRGMVNQYYNCAVSRGSTVKRKKYRYNKRDVDFFAVCVIPLDAWYFIPMEVVTSLTIKLYPHRDGTVGKYEKYRIK